MRSLTIAVLALVLLFNLTTFTQGQQPKYCPKTQTYPQPCDENGSLQCLRDFLNYFGAGSMPKGCSCKPAGATEHSCTCQIVCT
ncbi:hypothetical protein SLE2022_308720 [Rubroshorea leprosula]